eukprot:662488-Prorocentrum_minimum.AAC.3
MAIHFSCGRFTLPAGDSQAVMRINGAPTVGYERHVGSRTTLRYSNGDFFGWHESDDEVRNSPPR